MTGGRVGRRKPWGFLTVSVHEWRENRGDVERSERRERVTRPGPGSRRGRRKGRVSGAPTGRSSPPLYEPPPVDPRRSE